MKQIWLLFDNNNGYISLFDSLHQLSSSNRIGVNMSQRELERKMEEHLEEMRITQTIAYFSRTVELCFTECVHSFRSKKLDDKESNCVNTCAEKFLRHTMRSSIRLQESYAEVLEQQQKNQQQ